MHTQTFNVFNLRGMDERWRNEANEASLIQDMTWSGKDAWKDSGGYQQVFPIVDIDQPAGEDDTDASSSLRDQSPVWSLHWFSQHNGARQWTVLEEQVGSNELTPTETLLLRVFDGTVSNDSSTSPAPFRTLTRWQNNPLIGTTPIIQDRVPIDVGIKTQTESWGGNLYIVNGYNDPIVFNGEVCERAGFNTPPPAPLAKTHQWRDTSTCIVAVGSVPEDKEEYNAKRSKFGRWVDCFYSGMGSRGYAEIGTGGYKYGDADWDSSYRKMKNARLKSNEQSERRRVGWQYKVTYVNERGQESAPSEASNIAIFLNGTGKPNQHGKTFVSVDLPIGPVECVSRRVYRTRQLYDSSGDLVSRGYGDAYYFLKEIQDNMTTTWVDHHPDTHLGAMLDEGSLGGFPPGTKFLSTFKNTMFAAGSMQNTISYSAPMFPEVFPSGNEIHIGDEDGGAITGMRTTKNALVVFKTRGIYLIKGNPNNGFFAETLNKDVGCVAPDSLAEIPGLGLAFLSEKGVIVLEGALENTGSPTRVVTISTQIPDQMELINKSAAINSVGAVYLKDREYWLAVPINSQPNPNRVLVYHYEVGAWSIRDDFPISCATVTRDHRGYLFFGSKNRSADGIGATTGLCVYSRGFGTKGGTSVNPIYETTHLPFGNYFATVQPAHVMIYAVGMGDNDLHLNYEVNRSNQFVRGENQSADQQDPNHRFDVYNKARWGDSYWGKHRPTVIRYDVSTAAKGPVREMKIKISPETRRLEIVGYDIETKVGEQRRIKPLNEALRPDRR